MFSAIPAPHHRLDGGASNQAANRALRDVAERPPRLLDNYWVGFVAELRLEGRKLSLRLLAGRRVELKLVKVNRKITNQAVEISAFLSTIDDDLILSRAGACLLHRRVCSRPNIRRIVHDIVRHRGESTDRLVRVVFGHLLSHEYLRR